MISIIIPVYNVGVYLEKCLNSCSFQTFKDIEIIAINDGSTDDSPKILDDYILKDSRLKVFHQSNAGVTSAREKGISNAKGDWLMFVDADDYISQNAVEILLKKVLDNNLDIAVGGFFIERGKKTFKQENSLPFGTLPKGIAKALLSEQLQFSLCGKIFKKSLFKDVSVPMNLKIGEDALTVIQVCGFTTKIGVLQDPIYYYVQRESSVMHNPSKIAIQSRVEFVGLVDQFYKNKDYFFDKEFQIFYGRWLMNEYFAYLRMGGNTSNFDQRLIECINGVYLENSKSISLLPKWRIIFLKAYRISPVIGECFRQQFILTRAIVRKFESYK